MGEVTTAASKFEYLYVHEPLAGDHKKLLTKNSTIDWLRTVTNHMCCLHR
jgi:hypothetical protein